MSITQAEDALFAEWRTNREAFVADGVVDEECYSASKLRMLFVLKEVNDPESGSWDLREFLRNGARPQTWDNVTRWIEGIDGQHDKDDWSDFEKVDVGRRRLALREIAAINIKKAPGWHTSDPSKIAEAAVRDALLLTRQVEIYKADITICCGTGDVFFGATEVSPRPMWKRTPQGIWYYFNTIGKPVVSFVHPEARVQASIPYYALLSAVKHVQAA